MYEILKELMDEKGITQYKLAKELDGVSQSTLSDWKMGKTVPKADKLQKIADYFNVSVDYLLTGKDAQNDILIERADLFVQIRKDKALYEALKKYVSLEDKKKKHIINTINMLSDDE